MRPYSAVLWAALAWALGNCVFVYLFCEGAGTYRIESAVVVLVVLLLPRAIRDAATSTPRVELSRWEWAAAGGLAVALWAAVYRPLMSFPFLSDDYVFLDRYQHVGDIGESWQFFRPLFAAVFWWLATTFPESTAPFHQLSQLLHLGSSCLVHVLALRVFGANGPATLCFTVFLLNPLQLEAALWVSGLQELLWAFFVLAALVVYTGAAQLSWARVLATSVLAAAALLSKESAVCCVLLLPAADALLFRGERGALLPAAYVLFGIELVAYLLVRGRFAGLDAVYLADPSGFFVKQFVTLPYRFFAQPWNLSVAQVPPLVLCGSAMAAIALLFRTVAVRRTPRGVWVGTCVILLSTLPLYGYFYVRADLTSARYLYFAAAGWAFIVAAFAAALVTRPRAFAVAAGALAIVLAISLQLNVRAWRVAADIVTVMRDDLGSGRPPGAGLAQWSARTGVTPTYRGSIPYEYAGVGIFVNGYDAFVRRFSPSMPTSTTR